MAERFEDKLRERVNAVGMVTLSREERDALADAVGAARKVDEVYEGLRVDANDGEFALWSEDDLIAALHALRPALARLDGAA